MKKLQWGFSVYTVNIHTWCRGWHCHFHGSEALASLTGPHLCQQHVFIQDFIWYLHIYWGLPPLPTVLDGLRSSCLTPCPKKKQKAPDYEDTVFRLQEISEKEWLWIWYHRYILLCTHNFFFRRKEQQVFVYETSLLLLNHHWKFCCRNCKSLSGTIENFAVESGSHCQGPLCWRS